MHNTTVGSSSAYSFFHRYLLGESLKSSFIRLTLILSVIIIIWCGMIFALIIHMKCQRTKQLLKGPNTHHIYDSNTSLSRNRSLRLRRNRRFNSSSSSLSTPRCYSLRRFLSQLKPNCTFCSSTSPSSMTADEQSFNRKQNPEQMKTQSYLIQNINNRMVKRPINSQYDIIDVEKDTFSDGKSQDMLSNQLYTIQRLEPRCGFHSTSISLSYREKDDDHARKEHPKNLKQFNRVTTVYFEPVTRRFSKSNSNSLLSSNEFTSAQHCNPLKLTSSTRELTSSNEWKWHHPFLHEKMKKDSSALSSTRNIPLVMITDTSSSHTNIVELETFDDQPRPIGDIERLLSQELRASYKPRHST